tara:strand:+ start:28671 stop:28925 length:255 start_codon:yes stop_codon:yes gene_type:complete
MSTAKIVMLVIYAVLGALAVSMGETATGIWSLRILLLLAAVHAVETVVFFGLCKRAPGSLPAHVLNVFLFGVLHVQELKARGVQ